MNAFKEIFANIVQTKKSLYGMNRKSVHLALSPELRTGQKMHLDRVYTYRECIYRELTIYVKCTFNIYKSL